jgi:radical SAM protein with 4Fe4S-binding SPASM domain
VSDCGLSATVNTQITSLVIPQLPDLLDLFISAGARHWQVQLTVAMGRAADNPELLLQPYDLLQLMPLLAELFERGADAGLLLQPGNNIGYFGPYETLWRGNGDERFYWPGCNAGQNTLGIEADGTIKGCPSLPTSSYAGGNVRNTRLEKIWYETSELAFTRVDRTDSLWGFCRSCYYAQVCEGGCTWTSHSLLGRPGNNPYCHHRVLELSRLGLRERIARVETAPGLSFDHGRFDLVLEHLDGSPASRDTLNDHESAASRGKLVQITSRQTQVAALPATRGATPQLTLCRGCNRHIKLRTRTCPHCGQDTKTVRTAYRQKLRAAQKTSQRLAQLLGG